MQRSLLSWIAVLTLFCQPGVVWGQHANAPGASPPVVALSVLEELNATSYEAREQAMFRLLADDTLGPESILPLYQAAQTPEQRVRLATVAQHHLVRRLWSQMVGNRRGGAGSIGISHQGLNSGEAEGGRAGGGAGVGDPPVGGAGHAGVPGVTGNPRGAVRVARTLLGFPGAAHLRRGDVIIGINGTLLGEVPAPGGGMGVGAPGQAGEAGAPALPRGGGAQAIPGVPGGAGPGVPGVPGIPGAGGRDVEESFREMVLRSRAGLPGKT